MASSGRSYRTLQGLGSGGGRAPLIISLAAGTVGPLLVMGLDGAWYTLLVAVTLSLGRRLPSLPLVASFAVLYVVTALTRDPVAAILAFLAGAAYLSHGSPGMPRDSARMIMVASAFWIPMYVVVSAWSSSPGLEELGPLGRVLEAERSLLVVASLYAGAVAYSVLHPSPGLPDVVGAWRRVARNPLNVYRALFYGLGLYASRVEPTILVILMVALGSCLVVRMLTGRDRVGLLASILVFSALLYASGLDDNFDAYLYVNP